MLRDAALRMESKPDKPVTIYVRFTKWPTIGKYVKTKSTYIGTCPVSMATWRLLMGSDRGWMHLTKGTEGY
jgi:hypothetical protein